MGGTDYPVDDQGLHTFFSGDKPSHLAVPHYQRGYSWQQEHIDDFWGDLMEVKADPSEEYFFGSIVAIKDKTASGLLKYQLVDGQQRMATCAVLLTVIRDIYLKIGSALVKESEKEIFNLKRTKSDEYYYKIKLDDDDNDYLKNAIFETIDPKAMDKKDYVSKYDTQGFATRKNLKNAYIFFHKTIWEKINLWSLKQQEEELNDLRSILRTNFVVALLQVEKESKAYVLFDRLNSRGKDLALSDLVKDSILSLIDEEIKKGVCSIPLKDAIKMWKDISQSYLKKTSPLNDFLHHYLNAFETKNNKGKYKFNTKNKLYDKIHEITKKTSGEEFLKNLKNKNSTYKILKEAKPYPKISNEAKINLNWLKSLNVKIVYPLLMVGLEKFQKNDFEKLTSLCLKYMFRTKTVANVNASTLENEFAELAFEVYHNNMKLKEVRTRLVNSPNNPSPESFYSQMRDMEFQKSSHKAYALGQIIEHEQPVSVTDISPRSSIEHIMPQTLNDEWLKYIQTHNPAEVKNKDGAKVFQKRYLNYLGNCAIISLSKNISLGNKPYDEKVKKYGLSQITMTKSISKFTVWNLKSIMKRQTDFAKKAQIIWKL
jgi:uncharacterized protein with ParB-like and HNH nuclease domain